MNDEPKLYALHTTAPFDAVREITIRIAARTGHKAVLNETPDGAIVIVPRRVWGAGRWLAVTATLAAAPFAFHYLLPTASALQGFGLGWIAAVIVVLGRRR